MSTEQLLELWQGAAEVEVMHGKVWRRVWVDALADAAALYGVSTIYCTPRWLSGLPGSLRSRASIGRYAASGFAILA